MRLLFFLAGIRIRTACRCNLLRRLAASCDGPCPRVGSPCRLTNTGLSKMQPPPEVGDVSGSTRHTIQNFRRVYVVYLSVFVRNRGAGGTSGGGYIFNNPMLASDSESTWGCPYTLAYNPPEAGCICRQRIRTACRCNLLRRLAVSCDGPCPRVGSPCRLTNTGLSKMQPPPEVGDA